MSPGSNTESYPAFAQIGLRESPRKNLNQHDNHPVHTFQLIRDWFVSRENTELIDWPHSPPDLNSLENMQTQSVKNSSVDSMSVHIPHMLNETEVRIGLCAGQSKVITSVSSMNTLGSMRSGVVMYQNESDVRFELTTSVPQESRSRGLHGALMDGTADRGERAYAAREIARAAAYGVKGERTFPTLPEARRSGKIANSNSTRVCVRNCVSIRRPEFECSGPQLEGPEFECSGPQLEGPEFEYSELSLKVCGSRYCELEIGTLSTMENLQQILQAIAEMEAEMKKDISDVKAEMKKDISDVKAEMKDDMNDMNKHISEVKNDISDVKTEMKSDINLDKLNQNFITINETVAELRQDVDHFDGKIRDLERRQEETCVLMDQHAVENKHILALVDRQAREHKQIVAEEVRRAMQEAATELRTPYSGPAESSPSARHHNVKTPKFDGTTSWAIFRRQFEAIAEHNGWTPAEKTTQLLAALQGQASEILHSVPEDGTALEGRYGDHQLVAAFRTQLKTRVQQSGESLQEFAMAVEQLAHKALRGLPNDFIAGEAAYTFGSGVRDPEIRQQLLLAEHRTINAALAAALRMEAAKSAAGVSTPHRIRSVTATDAGGRQPKPPERQSTERRRRWAPTCWSCGKPGHLRRDCDQSGHREVADTERSQQSPEQRGRRVPTCWSCGEPGHPRRSCDRPGYSQEREGADARRSTSAPSSPSPRLVLKPVDRRCDDGLIAEGRIRGRPCRVLVDTGAMLTIARPDVVRGLPGRTPLRQYELRTASGESLPIQREVFLDLTLGKRKLEMWVFVANITEDVVLGLDAMWLLDATVDVQHRILCLGRDDVFLMDAEDQPVASELSLEGQGEKQDGAHALRVSLPSQAKDGVAPP
ncbi:hypothetical protein ANN_04656 [Periplaneta americana]|uniref:CCHC-type domain-containing protein n=1 Tax=Periplaneta americana TaxID=6978 RepID=A0ABQ8T901_PERAM|nr:hypothetical protein ANN_04656 [Periplaneta americana]